MSLPRIGLEICKSVDALISGFAMNFLQAFYFKKAGFLASITIRLDPYLIWQNYQGFMWK